MSRVGVVAIVVVAALALAGCAVEAGPRSTTTVTPVPMVPENSPPGLLTDAWAASSIPWGDVGPGWFVVSVVPSTAKPFDEFEYGWNLAEGSTWFVSPDGDAFRGPDAPDGAEWIPYWSGSEVWFAVYDPQEMAVEGLPGTVVAVDAVTGASRDAWGGFTYDLPADVFSSADGVHLAFGGCCSMWEIDVLSDGAVASVLSGDWGESQLAGLSPDGTSVAVLARDYTSEPEVDTLHWAGLDGSDRILATVAGPERIAGYAADGSIVLVTVSWLDENGVRSLVADSYQVVTLDGAVSPWDPPVSAPGYVENPAPGVWAWNLDDSTDWVVTDDAGSYVWALPCEAGTCDDAWPLVSGDRLLWNSGTRLGILDLATGEWTDVVDLTDGGIVAATAASDPLG